MLLEKLSLRLVKDMTLGNGRRMSLLTAMTIYNFLLDLIGAIQKSMCTFEINKENNFLWNKYFSFQKHFDQMSKIFQDQEHLSKKSCYNFFISNDPFVSQHGLGGSETKRWQKLISNETNSGLSRSRKQRTFYALLIFGCRGIDFWWTWRDRSRGRRGSIFAIIHPTLTWVCDTVTLCDTVCVHVTLVKVTRCDCWALAHRCTIFLCHLDLEICST